MSKTKKKCMAVIDIGSNSLRMKIGQQINDDESIILENLRFPLALGKDTFANGKISPKSLSKACKAINQFIKIAREYKIDKKYIKAIATSAVRESSNIQFVVDQISIETGLNVTVLDGSEEKTFVFKEMTRRLQNSGLSKMQALLVYIGSGNAYVSFYDKGTISVSQNIKIGSLRLSEQFLEMQDYTSNFYLLEEEYLKAMTASLINVLPKNTEIKHFVVSGTEIGTLNELCHSDNSEDMPYINREIFERFYDEIKEKTIDQLISIYNLSEDKADVFLPSVCIFKTLLGFTNASENATPVVYLVDAVLSEMLSPALANKSDEIFLNNIYASIAYIAKRYHCNTAHINRVTEYAKNIFDKVCKKHGFSEKYKLLLICACYLHEIGKFVNIRDYDEISGMIIERTDIIGLSEKDIRSIASIVNGHLKEPAANAIFEASVKSLSDINIFKLRAILMIADSLDVSVLTKPYDFTIKLDENNLIFSIESKSELLLEQWTFEANAAYFEMVFGIKPKLKVKRIY